MARARPVPPSLRAVLLVALACGTAALSGPAPGRAAGSGPSPAAACVAEPAGVPAARLRALGRGFNLTGWLDRRPAVAPRTDALAALRARGFTHVRLPVKAEFLSDASTPADVRETERQLAAALDALARLGFAVSIDLHPGAEVAALRSRDREAAYKVLDTAWRRIVSAHRSRSADRLFFEVLNEPSSEADYRDAVRLAATVRGLAPAHTIVLGPPSEQRVEALEQLTPLPDRNVVYAIHFYDPMAFTHQGLDWSGDEDPLRHFKGVPFPSSATHPAVRALGSRLVREGQRAAAAALAEQLADPWDEAQVERTFARAASWAERTGSAVIVNEFGVLGWQAPPADRARWLRAVTSAAERHCIGWTHWDYADGFGFMRRDADGRETPDAAILDALIGPPVRRAGR